MCGGSLKKNYWLPTHKTHNKKKLLIPLIVTLILTVCSAPNSSISSKENVRDRISIVRRPKGRPDFDSPIPTNKKWKWKWKLQNIV